MPLNKRPVSSLPTIGGGRVGAGSGVGEAGTSRGAKYCNRSCEIQRYKITAKIAAAKTTTSLRNVPRRSLATDLLFQPGDNRHDQADHTQDRHHAGGHHFTSADEFGNELRREKKRNNECGGDSGGPMFRQQESGDE